VAIQLGFEPVDDGAHELAQVVWTPSHRQRARVQARGVEQVRHQPIQSICLFLDLGQQLGAIGGCVRGAGLPEP
jgi:hypothetical protein